MELLAATGPSMSNILPTQYSTAKMKKSKSSFKKRANRTAARSSECRFTIQRTVSWGDCDPAGFIYTPRVLDFACEMLDAWFREQLKTSWWQLKSSAKDLGFPTVSAVCDFISIVRPDERLQLEMYIRRIGKSSITFEIHGWAETNRKAFRVKLVSCALDMTTSRATSIPPELRKRLEAYIIRNNLRIAP